MPPKKPKKQLTKLPDENLKQSAIEREAMLNRFGFIPVSILKISRGRLSSQMFNYQHESDNQRLLVRDPETGVMRSRPGNEFHYSSNRPTASIMPAELVQYFIKYYALPGQVYLDPFMGQGVQMQVAKVLGLDYYGYDCCEEYVRYIEGIVQRIDDGETVIKANLGDSRKPDKIPDGIGDFSFHSPPYWDIEYYDDSEAQLGYNQTYDDFLQGMEDVARAWMPKFKPGAFHVVNVNDFRRDGIFYPYHADTIKLFQRAGWQMHDVWVIEGLVGGFPRMFAVNKNKTRIAPKIHEYALVFRKPEG